MTMRAEAALRAAFRGRAGCATALDLATGKPLAHWRPDLVKTWAAAPGSVVKPLVAAALAPPLPVLPCRRTVRAAGLTLDCTHAPAAAPLDAAAALALSCNSWFAQVAPRVDAAVLARVFAGAEFAAPATPEAALLALLGVRGVRVTPAWLARAYWRLWMNAPGFVRRGLEMAVREGTAHAALPALAGKTGTSQEAAWFAGVNHSMLLVVALPAGTGGGDAAPLAGEVFAACAD